MTAELAIRGGMSLGAILAVTGGGIAVVVRVHQVPIRQSVLAQRWLTWAILAPLWLAAAAWLPARVALLAVLATISATEFARLRPSLVLVDRWILAGYAVIATLLVAVAVEPMVVVLIGLLVSAIVPLVSQDVRKGPHRVGDMTFGITLVIMPFVLLFALAEMTSGSLFFTFGLAVALSDVVAFIAGSLFGKRRMTTVLSPNKTYAGLAGSFVGALLGIAIAAAVGITPWTAIALAPLIAIGAVLGDLLISMLKRSQDVKDAGALLPGFGGLLDRVDSLLIATPLLLVFASVFGIAQ
jgi:phosphatidate cytidylyltransferase